MSRDDDGRTGEREFSAKRCALSLYSNLLVTSPKHSHLASAAYASALRCEPRRMDDMQACEACIREAAGKSLGTFLAGGGASRTFRGRP